jgi:aspartyl-tRNA(Asn)/glutamyl-tRNA(Gln) amidotransferase subunit A
VTEPALLSLVEVATAVRKRKISAVEATKSCLARIEARQPKLNAFIALESEQALAAARAADRALAKGRAGGPLHGVPLAHKDMYYRDGKVVTCGSALRRSWVADREATALSRLTAAGAINLGALNMAEFALGATGHNWHYGHVRNPWDPLRVPGGSSSGSGAAVAARLCFGALGSDTGGSIRAPAAFCGVAGMKPTYGRVSRAGAMPLSFTLDAVGPLARTVRDVARLTRVIAGRDPADPTSAADPVENYEAACGRGAKGLRIGVPRRYFFDDIDAAVGATVESALKVLKSAGARIVPVETPAMEPIVAAANVVGTAEPAALHRPWLAATPEKYGAQVRIRLENGTAYTAVQYIDALRYRAAALSEFLASFERADVLVTPTVSIATPMIAETDNDDPARFMAQNAAVTRCVRPINYLGLPALSIPCGFGADGMPVGMQIIGRPFDEATIFAVGGAYEAATDWHKQVPSAA